VREVQETQVGQVELFLNSVPILSPLTKEERLRLVDALEEVTFPAGACCRGVMMSSSSASMAAYSWTCQRAVPACK
jgi:hypothetical protein